MTRRTPLCPACKASVIVYRRRIPGSAGDTEPIAECTRCPWDSDTTYLPKATP